VIPTDDQKYQIILVDTKLDKKMLFDKLLKHDETKSKQLFSNRKVDTDENNEYFSHRLLMSEKDPMNQTIEASKEESATVNDIKSKHSFSGLISHQEED
jgi:hypothetical protein